MAEEIQDTTGAEAAAPAEPETPLTPKERRARRRQNARARTKQRAEMTPEERQADRDAERKRKAAQRQRRRAKRKVARAEHRAANPAQEELHAPEHGPGRPKRLQGIVVSDKADKMVVVRIDEARKHPRYRKVMRTSMKVHVHDEANDAHVGDTVRVVESRPMSRTKRWRLVEVVERAR